MLVERIVQAMKKIFKDETSPPSVLRSYFGAACPSSTPYGDESATDPTADWVH